MAKPFWSCVIWQSDGCRVARGGQEGYRYLHYGSAYAKCHDCNHKNEIVDASEYGINVMHNGEEMNVPEAIDGVHFKTI